MLSESSIQELRGRLRGELVLPSDASYDSARRVYNAMIDRHPAAIVRCVDVADVIACVNFASANGLFVAIRGGSHNVAGLAVCDDGLVIDLSRMRSVRVDPIKKTARVEGGCVWGDVDHATHPFGLAAPAGIISTTGVGGLTLGGGIGYLTKKYGLTLDNLVSVDIVTADGEFRIASAKSNPDLFWAVRGGGGNYGVVTSFEFKLHPVDTVVAGPIFYPLEKAAEVMKFFREFTKKAPADVNAFFGFQIGPPAPFIPQHLQGVTMCIIVACALGPTKKAESLVKPLREFGPPLLDLCAPIPFPALQSMFDPLLPAGLYHYWKADFINELTDEMIDIHVKYGAKVPSFQSTMHVYPLGGKSRTVKNDASAFSFREAKFVHVIPAMYPDPADNEKNKAWVREYWEALHPLSAGGAYVNFLYNDEGDERIAATYGDNYKRLVSLKNKYDPTNMFRFNQNIKPTARVKDNATPLGRVSHS